MSTVNEARATSDTLRRAVDRRLAQKNLRTGLIAGAISVVVLAASFLAAFVY